MLYEEDKVQINVPYEEERQIVFFKEQHKVDRDIVTASIVSFLKQLQLQSNGGDTAVEDSATTIRVADVFSGTGARALRVAKSVERLGLLQGKRGQIRLEAVDSSEEAVDCIADNTKRNDLSEERFQALQIDAIEYLRSRRNLLKVIELDPFGSVEKFLEPAINALHLDPDKEDEGALLSVATFDTDDLIGSGVHADRGHDSLGKRRTKFGSELPKGSTGTAAEECAIRIILNSLSEIAYRYRHAYIIPLICYNFDFGFRIIVRVHSGANAATGAHRHMYLWCACCQWILGVQSLLSKPETSLGCVLCRSDSVNSIGPLWSGNLFCPAFLKSALQGLKRHGGSESRQTLLFAIKEANVSSELCSFLFNMAVLVYAFGNTGGIPAKQLCRNVYSALRKRGYVVIMGSILVSCSSSFVLRSNSPPHVLLYTIKKEWKKLRGSQSRSSDSNSSIHHECKRRGSLSLRMAEYIEEGTIFFRASSPSENVLEDSIHKVESESVGRGNPVTLVFWTDMYSKKSQLLIQLSVSTVSGRQIIDELQRQDLVASFPPISLLHIAVPSTPNSSSLTEVTMGHIEINTEKVEGKEVLSLKIDDMVFTFPQQAFRYSVAFYDVALVDTSPHDGQENFAVSKGACNFEFYRCQFISRRTCLTLCSKARADLWKCTFAPANEADILGHHRDRPRKRPRRHNDNGNLQGRHIIITGQSRCDISECSFYGSHGPSVECRSGSEVRCKDSQFSDSSSSALFVQKDGKCFAVNVSIANSGWAGVEVRERGFAWLCRCVIQSSGRGGVYCVDKGTVLLEDTAVKNCAYSGLHFADGGRGSLRGSLHITENLGHGIFVQGKGAVAQIPLQRCSNSVMDLSSNSGDGIHVCTNGTLGLQCEKHETTDGLRSKEVQDLVSELIKKSYASSRLQESLINSRTISIG